MKKYLITFLAIVVVIAGYFVYRQGDKKIVEALYRCDNDKTISAVFYEARVSPKTTPGEPPQPTGSVQVSLDGGSVMTLLQTTSASGVRYANADESFVFWNKGDEALIMRNNEMDRSYTNCTASSEKQEMGASDPKNAAYLIEGQRVELSDGAAETPIAPDSASKIITRYFGNELVTDLDGDGRVDTAFILTQERGGSGVFFYAVAARNTPEGFVGSDGYLLGDRIAPQPTNVSMNPRHKNVVVFNWADRAPEEPMTAQPSIGKSVYLKLDPVTMQWGIVEPDFEGESR